LSWTDHAAWWQEHFTDGADPEYEEQILPLIVERLAGRRRVLDVGAGEGQVSRALSARGAEVVAVDPTWAQLTEVVARGGGVEAVAGTAERLPFAAESFDAAVACLVFEHVDDHEGAIAEVSRILCAGGLFLLLLNHPLLQTPGSGWIDDHVLDPPEQYWRIGDYLLPAETIDEVSPGVHIRFLHRPLHQYVNTLALHGLVITHMAEPEPPPGFIDLATGYAAARYVPRLLALDAVKLGDAPIGADPAVRVGPRTAER
jgi:SAM-dependent methyltransferase